MTISIWILLILFIIFLYGSYFAYKEVVVRKTVKPKLPPADNAPAVHKFFYNNQTAQLQWLEDWGYEKVLIINHQGAKLAGYYFKAKHPTTKTALAIHGYRCDGGFQEYMFFAPMYLEQLGMNLLLVDDYAHHNSEGKRIGFGWLDRLDCLSWTNWLIETKGADVEIILQGVSMGAATVLNAAGEDSLPFQVKAVVADCGFSSAKKEIQYIMKKTFKVPAFPIYYGASLLSKIFAGYFFGEGETIASVTKIKIPVLFIHGDSDTYVPTSMVYELFDACTSKKELIIVPGAEHADAFLTNQLRYSQAIEHLVETSFNN